MSVLSGGTRVGRAFVDVYATTVRLKDGLEEAELRVAQFVRNVGLAMAGLGASITAGLLPALNAAARQKETNNAFQMVFLGANDAANALADTLANRLRRSVAGIQRGMTPIGAMVRGLGLGADEAARFSAAVVQAGLDIASFYNESEEQTFMRLRSALSGSSEAVDQFGINLRAQALSAQLAAMGFTSNLQQATELEKTLARLAIIQQSLINQGAAGDLERTAASYANMSRSLGDVTRELLANVGDALIPMAERIQAVLARAIKGLADFAKAHPGLIRLVAVLGGTLVVTGGTLATIGSALAWVTWATMGWIGSLLILTRVLGGLGISLTVLRGALPALATGFGGLATALGALKEFPVLTAVAGGLQSLTLGIRGLLLLLPRLAAGAAAAIGPWGIALAVITALGVGLWQLQKHFRFADGMLERFAAGMSNLRLAGQRVWEFLQRFEEPLSRIGALIGRLVDDELNRFVLLMSRLADLLEPVATLLGDVFLTAAETILGTIVKAIELLEKAAARLGIKLGDDLGGALGRRGAPGQPPGAAAGADVAGIDEKARHRLEQFAEGIIDQTLTPLERFGQQMGSLNAALQEGLLTQEQYARGVAQAREDLARGMETPAQRAARQFAATVGEQVLTDEERYHREMRRLHAVRMAGLLTQEQFERAVQQQREKVHEAEQRRLDEQARAADQAARAEQAERKQRIEDRGKFEMQVARIRGDEQEQLRATFRQAEAFRQAGFSNEAREKYLEGLGMLMQNAQNTLQAAARMQDQAVMVTTNRREAAIGLGTTTYDAELVERAEQAERDRQKVITALEKLERTIAGE